jgi:hypothetical protein
MLQGQEIPVKKFLNYTLLCALMVPALLWTSAESAQLKKLYNPQDVVTLQGQIDRLETISRQGRQAVNGRKTQIAYLKTSHGTVVVHLGPAEFLARQQFFPKVGDSLEITGGRVDTRQGQVILATSVTAGGKTFRLRDANGIPVWQGQTPGCFGQNNRRTPARS